MSGFYILFDPPIYTGQRCTYCGSGLADRSLITRTLCIDCASRNVGASSASGVYGDDEQWHIAKTPRRVIAIGAALLSMRLRGEW